LYSSTQKDIDMGENDGDTSSMRMEKNRREF